MIVLEFILYLGIIAGSVSGTLVGMKKELDLFGVLFLAFVTSLGGGIIRDILIGNTPPVTFLEPSYLFVSISSSLLTWFFYDRTLRFGLTIQLTDAIGLGVFTAFGSYTAIEHGFEKPIIIVATGLITGIGGGILRDVFVREIPFVLQKEVYAIAAIIGAISILFTHNTLSPFFSQLICTVLTCAIRILAIMFRVNFPVRNVKNQNWDI